MSVPTLIMPKPYALIQPQASVISSSATFIGVQTGMIALIYETSDRFEGGESVIYDPTGRTSLTYDGEEYFLVKESNILGTEQTPP